MSTAPKTRAETETGTGAETAPGNQPGSPPASARNGEPGDDRLRQLRALLIGPGLEEIEKLRERLDDPEIHAQQLSERVAEAIAIRARQDRDVHVTLQPIIEEALRISVARDPAMLATALFPIIGEAVRKSVAHALRGIVESINQMLDRSISPESWKWRFEAWRTGKSFGEIALMRSLNYRVEQVFLIHRETGLLLQHVSVGDKVVEDTDMISGMLTAIQDFVRDSFGAKKSDELEVMEVGAYKLWLQHGPLVLLAAVVSGSPPTELRTVFEREIEAIHLGYGPALEAFDGDATAVAGTRENLQRCLLGRERPGKKRKPWGVWALATAVVLIAAALIGLRVRDTMRWNHYVERLRSEPGIVVTNEQRLWRGFSIVGLRDPLAPEPGKLLADYAVTAQKVDAHWEPYLSLDPKFSAARKVESDSATIEKQVLRFDLNSAQLRTDQFAVLETITDQIRALMHAAAANGQRIAIEVYGHTDHTGLQSKNVLLSQARAERVVRVLTQKGIPAEMLVAAGLGDQSAGQENADTNPAELDRRVTFKVMAKDASGR